MIMVKILVFHVYIKALSPRHRSITADNNSKKTTQLALICFSIFHHLNVLNIYIYNVFLMDRLIFEITFLVIFFSLQPFTVL